MSSQERPRILLLAGLPGPALALLEGAGTVVQVLDAAARQAYFAQAHDDITVAVTTGQAGLSAAEMDRLPSLGLACAMGVGYENLDVAHARARGIAVAHGPGVNSNSVADHALALTLACVRRIVPNHQASREGRDRHELPSPGELHGKKVGLFGLGDIGSRVAKRLGGFDVEVGYHTRNRRADVPYRHFDSLLELARWSDVLVLAAPGGPQTAGVVTREVLAALGQRGTLVNVARASLVDEAALAQALDERLIAGCALDVWVGEPKAPARFSDDPRVVLSPHVGGRSPESAVNMGRRLVENIEGWRAGQGPASPIV